MDAAAFAYAGYCHPRCLRTDGEWSTYKPAVDPRYVVVLARILNLKPQTLNPMPGAAGGGPRDENSHSL